jgi:hypothetical protein
LILAITGIALRSARNPRDLNSFALILLPKNGSPLTKRSLFVCSVPTPGDSIPLDRPVFLLRESSRTF